MVEITGSTVTGSSTIPGGGIVTGAAVLTRRTVHLDEVVFVIGPVIRGGLTRHTDTVTHTAHHTVSSVVADDLGAVVAVGVSRMRHAKGIPRRQRALTVAVTRVAAVSAHRLGGAVSLSGPLPLPVAAVGVN